ncbi:molybdate ABC transporter substrate-binding protein [Virgibacillus profundi]|uniref:Molybdate ABC transporter substrate-binding protein n=1 Tax=Virgibacillus profundi TaxID=2024555 RepID=A0A2A2I8Y5_9BACI|nr:molybdate ABC transporter substrate-binding protein [Virgibacillus profundi]PAV28471.1 molybdate ABC transporter substrate-binding protein [Virgibacillus profundi]PXY52644.1 molybdate ABC transporter substrate-binding protein [Virgibacillus profundi]
MRFILPFLMILLFTVGCSNEPIEKSEEKEELFISAATSLTDVMTDIVDTYKEDNPNTQVTLNFGGSGKLAQQIQQGAPVDIFLSADQKWMDTLENQELLAADTRSNFAKNKLVIISQKDSLISIKTLEDLQHKEIGQIAIGNPDSVPAGNYAKEALQHSNLWEGLTDQFVYAKDVRQVLTYVESGNTAIGFVYATDILMGNKVEQLAEIDEKLHKPIVYPAAVTSSSDNPVSAEKFVDFLQSKTAKSIFESYGFN